jgi:uncharacterized protein
VPGASSARPFRIRDPIHGFIELTASERAAIDTPVVQRLRSIGQLALTYLVYPGARHTRFEHSLGVCHVAGRLSAELGLSVRERRQVRHAALLHDIGHGPFSHVSENVLDDIAGVRGVHEAISVALIRTDPDLRGAIGRAACAAAADLVAPGPRTVQRDIVSGPTDADKLDYLLRDSYFAGVEYGRYDLHRLIDTATAIDADKPQSYLGFDEDGVWAVEGLLLARHHMHRQVYGHKTRVATDILIERAVMHGIADGVLPRAAYTVPVDGQGRPAPSRRFLAAYRSQTDDAVVQALLAQPRDTPSKDLVRRIMDRRLLRRAASLSLRDARTQLGGPRLGTILDRRRFAEHTEALEQAIADELSCPPYLVALRIDDVSNPTYRLPGSEINPKDILLRYADRPPDLFQLESEIFDTEAGDAVSFAHLYTPRLDQLTDERALELLWQALKSI